MQDAPTITWPTEEGGLYTVIMTGGCSCDGVCCPRSQANPVVCSSVCIHYYTAGSHLSKQRVFGLTENVKQYCLRRLHAHQHFYEYYLGVQISDPLLYTEW